MRRRLEDTRAGRDTPDDFAPGIWGVWMECKAPSVRRADALAADADLIAGIEATTPEQRSTFAHAMGPMSFDFDGFVALRLDEHAFHT